MVMPLIRSISLPNPCSRIATAISIRFFRGMEAPPRCSPTKLQRQPLQTLVPRPFCSIPRFEIRLVHQRVTRTIAINTHRAPATAVQVCRSDFWQPFYPAVQQSIWIAAACLLCFAACQLINAFAKLFRRRRLLPGIDGITGLTAVALLFMILSTLFLHFNHMRQLNRELLKNAGGQVDENTVLGRNFLERQSVHDDHSRQFMTSILVAAGPPLFVCLLSLSRVYVTLGEPDFTPSRRENP